MHGAILMIHYHIAFSLRDEASEPSVLQEIKMLLADMNARDAIAGFTLLKNRSDDGTTHPTPFQAIITFATEEQLAAAFREIGRTGVHAGVHGSVVAHVGRFHADTFDVIAD